MTETRDIDVYNPFTDEYEECFAEFDLHFNKHYLESATLVSVVTKADCEIINRIPSDEKGEIEEKFELEYRENMA